MELIVPEICDYLWRLDGCLVVLKCSGHRNVFYATPVISE